MEFASPSKYLDSRIANHAHTSPPRSLPLDSDSEDESADIFYTPKSPAEDLLRRLTPQVLKKMARTPGFSSRKLPVDVAQKIREYQENDAKRLFGSGNIPTPGRVAVGDASTPMSNRKLSRHVTEEVRFLKTLLEQEIKTRDELEIDNGRMREKLTTIGSAKKWKKQIERFRDNLTCLKDKFQSMMRSQLDEQKASTLQLLKLAQVSQQDQSEDHAEEMQRMKKQYEELENNLKIEGHNIDILRTEIENLTRQKNEYSGMNSNLEEQIHVLQQDKDCLSREKIKLEETVENLLEENDEVKLRREELESASKQMANGCNSLRREKETLLKCKCDLKGDVEMLQGILEERDEEIESLKSTKSDLLRKMNDVLELSDCRANEYQILRAENDKLLATKCDLEGGIQTLQSQFEAEKHARACSEKLCTEKSKEVNRMGTEIETQISEIKTFKGKQEKLVGKLEESEKKIEQMRRQTAQNDENIEVIIDEKSKMARNCEEVEENNKLLETILRNQKAELVSVKQKLHSEEGRKKQLETKLMQNVRGKEVVILNLRKEVDTVRSELDREINSKQDLVSAVRGGVHGLIPHMEEGENQEVKHQLANIGEHIERGAEQLSLVLKEKDCLLSTKQEVDAEREEKKRLFDLNRMLAERLQKYKKELSYGGGLCVSDFYNRRLLFLRSIMK